MELVTGKLIFHEEQLEEVSAYASDLERVVQKFSINPSRVTAREAAELSSGDDGRVFTLEMSWESPGGPVFRVGYRLSPGLLDDCDDYFVAEKSAVQAEVSEDLYTELAVFCPNCEDGVNPDDGSECRQCDDGEFIFDLTWDQFGKVTARVDAA